MQTWDLKPQQTAASMLPLGSVLAYVQTAQVAAFMQLLLCMH